VHDTTKQSSPVNCSFMPTVSVGPFSRDTNTSVRRYLCDNPVKGSLSSPARGCDLMIVPFMKSQLIFPARNSYVYKTLEGLSENSGFEIE